MEAVSRALSRADVADGIALDDPFGHVIVKGRFVPDPCGSAESFGINPCRCVCCGCRLKAEKLVQLFFDELEAVEQFVHSVLYWL